jgi:hypothetical protein
MKRSGAPARSFGPFGRSGRRRQSRRRTGGQTELAEAERLADIGWVEWGGEMIWVAGFTAGGAPFGLRACELDPAERQAMGLEHAVPASAGAWIDESDHWLPGSEGEYE